MTEVSGRWGRSEAVRSIREALELLPPSSRPRLVLLVIANVVISVADLVGVLLIGLLSLAVMSASGGAQASSSTSSGLAALVPIDSIATPSGIVLLASGALGFLVFKSVVGSWLSYRTLLFLANRQAAASRLLLDRLLTQPISWIQLRTKHDITYALTGGVTAAVVGLLGAAALAAAELALVGLLGLALLNLNATVTIVAAAFFGGVGVIMHVMLGRRAAAVGLVFGRARAGLARLIHESLDNYRELTTTRRMSTFTEADAHLFLNESRSAARAAFMAQFPKYIYEAALLLGALALAVWAVRQDDPAEAVATVAVFLTAGTRIVPSMLRLQNCLTSIRSSQGQAQGTFELYRDLNAVDAAPSPPNSAPSSEHPIAPTIIAKHVCARYPTSDTDTISDVSFVIPGGSTIAIVGPTGAGKSTVADVILGLLPLSAGSVSIADMTPQEALDRYPGLAYYVPQTVSLIAGSVRENVAIGVAAGSVDDARVWSALASVGLRALFESANGLETEVGEHGVRLSGGQKQRVGLARALYRPPSILVLDEATSALDAETEAAVAESIDELSQHSTIIIIAHRLATVQRADQVAYVDHGQLMALGTFDEVRSAVPGLDRSARLLGL